MKLYGTIQSERAEKGQGGNKFLEYRLNVGDKNDSKRVVYIRAELKDEDYLITSEIDGKTSQTLIPKAKRQKGECKNGCAYHSQNEECTDIPS